MRPARAVGRGDAEVPVFTHHRLDPLILAEVDVIVLGDFAVVLERLFARRFL